MADVGVGPLGSDRLTAMLELHDQQVRPVRVGDVLRVGQEGWWRVIGWTPVDVPAGEQHLLVETCDDDTPLTLHARGAFTLTMRPADRRT